MKVLLVRLDAIGDWILFRNVFRALRNSSKYVNAHFTVFGNPAWRTLAETFDRDLADEWIWAEDRAALFRRSRENLMPEFIWRRRVARDQNRVKKMLARYKFDEVLNLQATRNELLDDFCAKLASKVVNGWELDQGKCPFMFLRNLAIASDLTGERLSAKLELSLGIDFAKDDGSAEVMLFNQASHWTKRWAHFGKLKRCLGEKAIFAPKNLTLPELAVKMKQMRQVITNDTMALHLAAALGVRVTGIVNGVSGKDDFWPYPASLGKEVTIVSPSKRPLALPTLLGRQIAQYLALRSVRVCAENGVHGRILATDHVDGN